MSMVSEDHDTTGLVWSASRSRSERRGATRPASRRAVADWVVPMRRASSAMSRTGRSVTARRTSRRAEPTGHGHVAGAHGAGPVGRHRLEKVRKLSSCRLRRQWPSVLLSAGLSTRQWSQPASIRTFDYWLRVQRFAWPGAMPRSGARATGGGRGLHRSGARRPPRRTPDGTRPGCRGCPDPASLRPGTAGRSLRRCPLSSRS